jgi:hypothetical protein
MVSSTVELEEGIRDEIRITVGLHSSGEAGRTWRDARYIGTFWWMNGLGLDGPEERGIGLEVLGDSVVGKEVARSSRRVQ